MATRPSLSIASWFDDRRIWRLALIIFLFGVTLFIVRETGYQTMAQNEWRLSAYVLDAIQNGRWFCPSDNTGELASKPPLLAWTAAWVGLMTGQVDLVALHLPTALAAIMTALVLLKVGSDTFGWQAGLLSAFSYLACANAYSMIATARYDGSLTLFVTLGAVAAFRAWESGRGWTWFWLWTALGTLVKGPVAVLLAASGLLAVFWERRQGDAPPLRGKSWPGLSLFLVLVGGWFALAYHEVGTGLIDKMLRRELIGHAAGLEERSSAFASLPDPTLAFLSGYAPWSLIALVGLWRVYKTPAVNGTERRFERFLLCWFLVGLVIFSVAAHQRGRLIYPIVPAAAMLAGRELSRWLSRWPRLRLVPIVGAVASTLIVIGFVHSHVFLGRSHRAQRVLAMDSLARRLHILGQAEFPLTYVEDPWGLQVILRTHRQQVSAQAAAALLAGSTPAFVVLEDAEAFRKQLPTGVAVTELYRWPANKNPEICILSNYPRLEWPDHTAFLLEGLRFETEGARLLAAHQDDLTFEARTNSAVTISNVSAQPRLVNVRSVNQARADVAHAQRRLAPGSSWHTHLN